MAKGKVAAKGAQAKSGAKVQKITKKPKIKPIMDRAAAVEENLGASQPLRSFLIKAGW